MNKIIVTIEAKNEVVDTIIQKESSEDTTWMAILKEFIFSLEGIGYSIRSYGKEYTIDDILNSED